MGDADVLNMARQALSVLLVISAPPLLIAMGVGLIISLFQALTQVQEATIAFVPKILILFASFLFLIPFMGQRLVDFGVSIGPMLVAVGGHQ